MNKILYIIVALCINCVYAQKAPDAAKKAFNQKFPKAGNVKWGKEKANEWEAEFTLNGTKTSANFTSDGSWLETETEIPIAQLPEAVQNSAKKMYQTGKIIGADKIERPNKETLYEVELSIGNKKKEVILKEDGSLGK